MVSHATGKVRQPSGFLDPQLSLEITIRKDHNSRPARVSRFNSWCGR